MEILNESLQFDVVEIIIEFIYRLVILYGFNMGALFVLNLLYIELLKIVNRDK